MILTFVLLALGLFFVLLEFYMPGSLMAIIGGFMLLTAIILFADQTQSLPWTLLFVAAEIFFLYLLIRFMVTYIPRAKGAMSIYSNKDQAGYQASEYDVKAVGKKGKVIADLKPGGYIIVDGKKQAAISESGYIARGADVEVIGGEGESLIVKKNLSQ